MNHSDRVVVMALGAVIAEGEPDEVRSDQKVIDAYLGGGGEEDAGRADGDRPQGPRSVVAGYPPEVDILNGVAIAVPRGRDRHRSSAPTAPASRR